MALSQAALQAILAQQTAKVFLECLTIDHVGLPAPLRLVNDTQDLERAAGSFSRFPFQVGGVRQDEQQLPQMTITADNVDQRILQALRPLAGSGTDITVTYEVVLADTPDVIEYGPLDFRVDDVAVSLRTVTLTVSYQSGFLNAAFPSRQFGPSNAG